MKQNYFRSKILPLSDKLFRLALSITGNRQDAEDVVQDALLNVWKKDEWEAIENPEAYCFRSIRNIAIDKISLKENQQEAWNETYDKPDAVVSVQEKLEQEEQLFLLENAIRQLPEKQRTVFQLREVEELNYKQIAEVMNISEEQVKVNLFRARQKIKAFFERLS
ncbi:DNA-directed RNA polymerase sigma-70 factor [Bacteroidia bacterium]|nr:DNA-directed RNA polymerase sigma-70 factor [Bacteroidia bacterium]